MSDTWRYLVTIETGVSIGVKKYVEVVTLDTVAPDEAAKRALQLVVKRDPDNQIWQSDRLSIVVERER